jgi:HK97 family phage portal protein
VNILERLFGRKPERRNSDSAGGWISEETVASVLARVSGADGGYSLRTASGVTITPDTAMQATTVYACVRILSETVASLPLPLYRRVGDRGRERAIDHPLYTLLHDAPNPEMTSFELRETLMGHLALWGNSYCDIETDGAGRVTALWPLRPDKMAVRRDKGTGLIVYEYTLPGTMQKVQLAADRILHLRGLSVNGLVGLPPIAMARQSIGLAIATEEFGARFFSNNAQPGVVLEHPGKLGEEAYTRLRESWSETHSGLSNAHRVAILEEGMKLDKIGIPPNDAQFLETRKFQAVEIARIFRVPPHLIGDLDRATFSNIEQQSLEFVIHTIRPWLVRIEQAITRSLLMPSERRTYFAEFLVDGLLRGDTTSRYQAYAIGRQWGWLSINDVRERENMNPVAGGDAYLEPLNMTEAGANPPPAAPAPAEPDPARSLRVETDSIRSVATEMGPIYRDATDRIARRISRDVLTACQRYLTRGDWQGWNHWLAPWQVETEAWMVATVAPIARSHAAIAGRTSDAWSTKVGRWASQELLWTLDWIRRIVDGSRSGVVDPAVAMFHIEQELHADDWALALALLIEETDGKTN